jgi:hypothetical protein
MVRAVLVAAAVAAAAFVGSSTAARGGCFPDCYPIGDFAPQWSADGSAIGFFRGPGSAYVTAVGRVGSTGRGVATRPSSGNVSPDTISCGTMVKRDSVERDEVFADRSDAVARDCEVAHGRAAVARPARLRITVWPKGREAGAGILHTLRCDPAGGTLSRPAAACRRLASLHRPFAPVPRDVACSQIYGGPQEALVTGTFDERKVWARFNRRDGCQTDRWNRHAFLFAA